MAPAGPPPRLPQFPHRGGLPKCRHLQILSPGPFASRTSSPPAPCTSDPKGTQRDSPAPRGPRPQGPQNPSPDGTSQRGCSIPVGLILGPLCLPPRCCVLAAAVNRAWGRGDWGGLTGPRTIAGGESWGHRLWGSPGFWAGLEPAPPAAPLCLTLSSPARELPEQNIFQVRGYVTNISV